MLQFIGATKKYGNKPALNDVSINFEPGKIYALVGPNGSGKSTLMKIAAGLVKPSSGTASFNNQPIGAETRKNIAYMPTEPYYYDYMSISVVGKYCKDFYNDFDESKFAQIIGFMGLDMKMKVKSLSSGMNAKLKIASNLARNAKVIMLDEPLNGIDLIARDQIINSIKHWTSSECSFIISSHLFEELEPIVDNVVMLKDGQVIIQGNIDDVRKQSGKSISDIYREVYGGYLYNPQNPMNVQFQQYPQQGYPQVPQYPQQGYPQAAPQYPQQGYPQVPPQYPQNAQYQQPMQNPQNQVQQNLQSNGAENAQNLNQQQNGGNGNA